jgi:hypothetical protein
MAPGLRQLWERELELFQSPGNHRCVEVLESEQREQEWERQEKGYGAEAARD